MQGILIAAGIMGALGLLFGAVLSIIGQKFSVPVDPVQQSVRELLPGANCGACGYPGCDGYATAVASGKAPVNSCPVGGDSVSAKIGEVMGVRADAQVKMAAMVMCRGGMDRCGTRFTYEGPQDCKSAVLVASGDKACAYSCLGFGDCQKACPYGAITINDQRLAVVDETKCKGCTMCVASCPRGILKMMPTGHAIRRKCSTKDRGKAVRDICETGCVSCGKCERMCKFGALKMVNGLPEVDHDKCVGCMQCADNCPTYALKARESERKHAVINLRKCDACDECAKVCQFSAIIRNDEGKHIVIDWNCTGCGQCVGACKHKCIKLVPGVKHKDD